MLFSYVPVYATGVNQASDTEEAPSTDIISDIENAYTDSVLGELLVLEEITELRAANVKHFSLSNGMKKAVAYSQPVHYLDENGTWVDIDNSLTLSGNEYSTKNKHKIKFANKSGSNGLLSIKDGDYKIDFTPLNTNKVNVTIENPQENDSRKFDDVKALKNLISKATYSSIYNGVDLEYILIGNNIKENIIVNSKQDSYVYSFELKLNKLTAELSNGSIILSDSTTGEKIYEIPAPYMYDSNGTVSYAVEYSLVQNSTWKYTFTVTANAEWINSDERAFPITIDPTILGATVDVDVDTDFPSDCEGCDVCSICNGCVGCDFCNLKAICLNCEYCQSSIICTNCKECNDGINCIDCEICQATTPCRECETCQVCNECENGCNCHRDFHFAQDNLIIGNFFGVTDIAGFLKFDTLPDIQPGAFLVEAKLAMRASTVYSDDDTDFYIGVFKATKDWVSDATFSYATSSTYYNATPENSVLITETGLYEWDIMSLYKQWKNGTANHGICVKAVNLASTAPVAAIFSSLETGNVAPQIELTYVEPKGIEDYYGTLSTPLGDVGEGHINLYNGALTYINKLTTIENQAFSYDINMVYNSIDKSWTPSYSERIELFNYEGDDIGNNITRYIWHDPDGTKHLFTPYLQKNYYGAYIQYEEAPNGYLWSTDNPSVFYPEDDIDYVLLKIADGEFILQNYDGTQKLFDSNGRLSRICDAQGNALHFSYVNNRLSLVDYKTFDNEFTTHVRLTYYTSGNLKTIYNFATQLEVSFNWSGTKTTKIMYNYKDSPIHKEIDFAYYTSSGILGRVMDSTDEIYIEYGKDETTNKFINVMEYSKVNSTYMLQRQNSIQYNTDNTICTDTATDLTLNTNDDVRKKYTFDEKGREYSFSVGNGTDTYFSLISTYEYDDEILPDDIYYTISYNNNIYSELYVDESEANIVRYDIGVGEEEFLNFSNLPTTSTNVASNANETTIESYNNETSASRSIILPDERQKIANTMQEPYNSICYIETTYNNLWNNNTGTRRPRTFIGSGFLAGDNLLITAGHVLYGDVTEPDSAYDDGIYNPIFPDEIIVYPGSYLDNNGNIVAPYGSFHIETCYIQKQYYDSTTFEYDWGICILESNIGNQVGWFDISITSNSIVNEEISVIGYPGDKDGDMYYAEGVVLSVTDYRFLHNSDTVGGSSGSPVFIKDDSAYIVKGIHTSGSSTANGATRINSFIYTFAMNLKTNE